MIYQGAIPREEFDELPTRPDISEEDVDAVVRAIGKDETRRYQYPRSYLRAVSRW